MTAVESLTNEVPSIQSEDRRDRSDASVLIMVFPQAVCARAGPMPSGELCDAGGEGDVPPASCTEAVRYRGNPAPPQGQGPADPPVSASNECTVLHKKVSVVG
jgi:hypothetical protein